MHVIYPYKNIHRLFSSQKATCFSIVQKNVYDWDALSLLYCSCINHVICSGEKKEHFMNKTAFGSV